MSKTETETHERAYRVILNDFCTDEEFELVKKWHGENDPVAVRIIGFYKMKGYRVPVDTCGGWEELNRASDLGDLLAMTFIGLSWCRGIGINDFRITPSYGTYIRGRALVEKAANMGWKPAAELLKTL